METPPLPSTAPPPFVFASLRSPFLFSLLSFLSFSPFNRHKSSLPSRISRRPPDDSIRRTAFSTTISTWVNYESDIRGKYRYGNIGMEKVENLYRWSFFAARLYCRSMAWTTMAGNEFIAVISRRPQGVGARC